MWIEPRGFEEVHTRGNVEQHRLQDAAKWVPYGVGAIEGSSRGSLPVLEPGSVPPARRLLVRTGRVTAELRPRRRAPTTRGCPDSLGTRRASLALSPRTARRG